MKLEIECSPIEAAQISALASIIIGDGGGGPTLAMVYGTILQVLRFTQKTAVPMFGEYLNSSVLTNIAIEANTIATEWEERNG